MTYLEEWRASEVLEMLELAAILAELDTDLAEDAAQWEA